MKKEEPDVYNNRIKQFEENLKKLKKKNRTVSFSRLAIFITAILLSFYLKKYGVNYVLINIGVFFVPFLFLIKVNSNLLNKIKHLEELIRINFNELEGLKGNNSVFRGGKEYINSNHPYSFDLDIFGSKSIYQLLNRTSTKGGADKLADWLKSPLLNKKAITERQESVKELSTEIDWRQNFNATGNNVLEIEDDNETNTSWFQKNKKNYSNDALFNKEILEWVKEPFKFLNYKILPYILIVLPLISIVLFTLLLLGKIPIMGFIIYGLVLLFIVGNYVKYINLVHNRVAKKVKILDKYEKLLTLIENKDFKTDNFTSLKSKLNNNNASSEIKKLKSLVRALDNRLNILFAFLANAYLLWDMQVVYKLEKWRKQNADNLEVWFNVIYEFDAISSLATFSYNNKNYCTPEVSNSEFILNYKEAGHPLINPDDLVENDYSIKNLSRFDIITGANMAGKSTFLRTVGVNLILAMAGSVVCAKNFEFTPILLHTSIRTSDSIQESESYFYAELKRLKSIIDRLNNNERLFIIIDEMLRGTNSKDKHHGSEALTAQLLKLKASGLIATHDIALGNLKIIFPDNIRNFRFEVEIKNNELDFDYKIKTGVSQNLNATFLMKKMGITI